MGKLILPSASIFCLWNPESKNFGLFRVYYTAIFDDVRANYPMALSFVSGHGLLLVGDVAWGYRLLSQVLGRTITLLLPLLVPHPWSAPRRETGTLPSTFSEQSHLSWMRPPVLTDGLPSAISVAGILPYVDSFDALKFHFIPLLD